MAFRRGYTTGDINPFRDIVQNTSKYFVKILPEDAIVVKENTEIVLLNKDESPEQRIDGDAVHIPRVKFEEVKRDEH